MTIDSRAVTSALRAGVFPILREAGFSDFAARTAWRTDANVIAVLDFPSLGSHLGSRLGVTSHSFSATAGLYYKAVHATPWAEGPVPDLPEECRCQARLGLRKKLFQFWCWRPDVWYVKRTGANLDSAVGDAIRAVREQVLPWLHAMADLPRALEAFESRQESEMRPGIMHELLGGALNSFARAEVASALALACDQPERARAAWERMLGNPYYQGPGEMRSRAEERIRLIQGR